LRITYQPPSVLSDEECDRIIDEAKKLVCEIDIACDGTDEFNSYMSAFGCVIEKGKIKILKKVVEQVFERIKENNKNNSETAKNDDVYSLGYGISGQAGLIHDLDGKIRPSLSDDLAKYTRFIDSFDNIEWHHPGFLPQDAPPWTRDIHAYAIIALNNSRSRKVSVYSKEAVKYFMRISEICYGSYEAAKRKAPFIHKIFISSPFAISREVIEGAMEVRRVLGKPLRVFTMPVSGASAPVTLAGCLVQEAAEVIIENVITLAVDNELNGYSAGSLLMDVRQGLSTTSPEGIILQIGSGNIARRIFKKTELLLEHRHISLGTIAKNPGEQSMMEKSISALFGLLNGRRNFSGMGTLAYSDICSPTQFLLDLELINYIRRIDKGIKVTDDTLAVDVIKKVAPTGANFMTCDHTLKHYSDQQWLPMFMDRKIAMSWIENPKTMLDNATEKASDLWGKSPNRCPLDNQQKHEIMKILKEADSELKK